MSIVSIACLPFLFALPLADALIMTLFHVAPRASLAVFSQLRLRKATQPYRVRRAELR